MKWFMGLFINIVPVMDLSYYTSGNKSPYKKSYIRHGTLVKALSKDISARASKLYKLTPKKV